MKIIVIGMNPSHSNAKSRVRKNSTLDRLGGWMTSLNVDTFSFMNTFHVPSYNPKLSDVDFKTLELAREYPKVLALGAFVSAALSKANISHFCLSHPSPRNRKLNDPKFEKVMLKQCYNYLYT